MQESVFPYLEMCQREGLSLQKGMNYRARPGYSILLMSTRQGAPYADRFEENDTVLIYEGHDQSRSASKNPKAEDQPEFTRRGNLTENGKFHQAAQFHKQKGYLPERVRVYEKIRNGIWSDNGMFLLVDSWRKWDGQRFVFKFKLVAIDDASEPQTGELVPMERRRLIPSWVKQEVWARDGGKCVVCGSQTDLHYDHIIPYSKGGSSETPENIQLLCIRHNLQKGARIE